MVKVITYGTYDMLHFGHIRLLERAKALGDYLIVGVTADGFDLTRGKINVDIFTVGSDWEGKFDYLNEYCKVIYLPRTQGVSSSEIRSTNRELRLGLVGESAHLIKFYKECSYVNGVKVIGVCVSDKSTVERDLGKIPFVTSDFYSLLNHVDAVYLLSHPTKHYVQAKKALQKKKHVLCEAPISLKVSEAEELYKLADTQGCVIMSGIKTAFSTAYYRLVLLVKSGRIGKPVSIDTTCTSMRFFNPDDDKSLDTDWNSICSWGPAAMLPVFHILGTNYIKKEIITSFANEDRMYDRFTHVNFLYNNAVATVKVAKGIKAEGELVISGTEGYIYVPAPWWKTDYFEIRYENQADNKKFFYQLEGEGIRYELLNFLNIINNFQENHYITREVSLAIVAVIEQFYAQKYRKI